MISNTHHQLKEVKIKRQQKDATDLAQLLRICSTNPNLNSNEFCKTDDIDLVLASSGLILDSGGSASKSSSASGSTCCDSGSSSPPNEVILGHTALWTNGSCGSLDTSAMNSTNSSATNSNKSLSKGELLFSKGDSSLSSLSKGDHLFSKGDRSMVGSSSSTDTSIFFREDPPPKEKINHQRKSSQVCK